MRQRRVVLAPVVVDEIDEALDVMLLPTTAVMAARPKTNAGVDHEISECVVLCRPAGMSKPPRAQRAVGQWRCSARRASASSATRSSAPAMSLRR
jgi:hypothetical protein